MDITRKLQTITNMQCSISAYSFDIYTLFKLVHCSKFDKNEAFKGPCIAVKNMNQTYKYIYLSCDSPIAIPELDFNVKAGHGRRTKPKSE